MRGRVRLELAGVRLAEVPATALTGPRLELRAASAELDDDDVEAVRDELTVYLEERGRR